jgi:cytochrome oxidase Cu insertion factor (SCO1/SenC/PrrC family)
MKGRALHIMIVLGVAVVAILVVQRLEKDEPLQEMSQNPDSLLVYGTLPDFSLTNHLGKACGTRELIGKTWIANFIFTRCPATCPIQTTMMGKLQEQLSSRPEWKHIRLISFSVDPGYDTVEVLNTFAGEAGAQDDHWYFLTGPRSDIWQLSKVGFKLAVGEAQPDAASPLFHSPKMVLVDAQGSIRGYFDGMSEEGNANIGAALRMLFRQ